MTAQQHREPQRRGSRLRTPCEISGILPGPVVSTKSRNVGVK